MANEDIIIKVRNLTSAELQRMSQDFASLTRAEQQAGREALRLAQSEAAIKRASGDAAGAVRVLSGALDTARADAAQYSSAARQLVSANQAVTQSSRSTAGEIVRATQSVIALAAASRTLSTGIELAQLGAQASQTAVRFDQAARAAGTTGEAYTAALRAASANTISDLNLQLAANRARLLGVADGAAQMAPLLAIARDRAQEMGISTTQAFGDLVVGLGRGSALILDNLGLTISVAEANKTYAAQLGKTVGALTEAEQKQALINAVLEQGKDALDNAGGAAETSATKIERLDASWQNLKATAGIKLADWFTPAITGAERVLRGQEGLNEAYAASAALNKGAAAGQQAYTAALAAGATESEALAVGQQVAAQVASDYAAALPAIGAGLQTVSDMLNQHAAAHRSTAGTMAGEIDAAIQLNDATRQNANALSEETLKKIDSQMASAALADEQKRLEADSILAAQGMLSAGNQAEALALKYGFAEEQARFLINAQQQLTNGAALADQRAGERDGGSSRTATQITTAADAARARARRDEQEQARIDAAKRSFAFASLKTDAQRIAFLQRELAGTTDLAKRYDLQTQILNLRNNTAKSHTSELGQQLRLSESIYDSEQKRYRAALDARIAENEDARQDILDEDKINRANFAAANARDPRIRALAALEVQRIGLDDAKRNADIQDKLITAGAPIGPGGKLFQSLAGAPPGAGSATTAGGPPPLAAPGGPGAAGGAGGVFQFFITLDGDEIAAKVETRVAGRALAGGRANIATGGGRGAP